MKYPGSLSATVGQIANEAYEAMMFAHEAMHKIALRSATSMEVLDELGAALVNSANTFACQSTTIRNNSVDYRRPTIRIIMCHTSSND